MQLQNLSESRGIHSRTPEINGTSVSPDYLSLNEFKL